MRASILAVSLSMLFVGFARADSLNVRLVGVCDTLGASYGVAVRDSLAFVAASAYGLEVISVADPSHPVEMTSRP